MYTLLQFIVLIGFLVAIMTVFHLYTRLLGKIMQKSIQKKIDKGKLSDKQLLILFNAADKGRKNKWTAIFMYGIFFKSYLLMQEKTYQLYKQEMENRGLETGWDSYRH